MAIKKPVARALEHLKACCIEIVDRYQEGVLDSVQAKRRLVEEVEIVLHNLNPKAFADVLYLRLELPEGIDFGEPTGDIISVRVLPQVGIADDGTPARNIVAYILVRVKSLSEALGIVERKRADEKVKLTAWSYGATRV